MSLNVQSIVYGDDDKLTACIASWQLAHGNKLLGSVLGSMLERFLLAEHSYFVGEEKTLGILYLKTLYFGYARWDKIKPEWSSFLVHARDNFQLTWEMVVVDRTRQVVVVDQRSHGGKRLLKPQSPPIVFEGQAIPGTNRSVLAL